MAIFKYLFGSFLMRQYMAFLEKNSSRFLKKAPYNSTIITLGYRDIFNNLILLQAYKSPKFTLYAFTPNWMAFDALPNSLPR